MKRKEAKKEWTHRGPRYDSAGGNKNTDTRFDRNIRVYNIKENNNHADMIQFVETLIHEILDIPK